MPKPRRKRFTVSFTARNSNKVEKTVILAQDAPQVREHYAARGCTVLEVSEGDYRKRDAIPSGARPSALAVRQAEVLLGLKLPVEIKLSSRASFTWGGYRPLPTDPSLTVKGGRILGPVNTAAPTFRHQIVLKAWLTAEEMGETLWHELTHAQQFERESLPHGVSCAKVLKAWNEYYRDGVSYKSKRQERQADANMKNNATIPLCRQST